MTSEAAGTMDPALSTPAALADSLSVDLDRGLSQTEAASRLETHGPNKLAEPDPPSAFKRFVDQFRNVLVYVLLGAAVVAAAVGDLKDPIVILVVLTINAVFGFIQEYRADAAMASLASMLELVVRARRDGELHEVSAADLVPGDVVILEAGDRLPADGRFVGANNLGVEEAALTGESLPSDKHTATLAPDEASAIGDRNNCGFMNTTVVRGRGELLVTSTGMDTEVGRLAGLLGDAPEQQTPLQRQLDVLGKRLALIAVGAVLVVFALAIAQGEELADALLESVALAVAAIPEGLPAVVTVTLALGVARMADHNAIVKRLASVETLGSTTAICSDKTGTLTLNQMTATHVVRGGSTCQVSGLGYAPAGRIELPDGTDPLPDLAAALEMGALCNDAVVRLGVDVPEEPGAGEPDPTAADSGEPVARVTDTRPAVYEVVGDPTEAALVVLAQKAGLDPTGLRSERPRVAEVPFDSTIKYMATLHDDPDDPDASLLVVKGAPDVLMERCSEVAGHLDPAGSLVNVALDGAVREELEVANRELGERGLRVLALASKRLPVRAAEFEADLAGEVVGLRMETLIGILDPPRQEAVAAIERCHHAGIAVRMITGDHAATAGAIADQLGIEGDVITGAEIEALGDDELAERIEAIGVCARVSPEHKVRVVTALQANGEVVAMTGDGVNDAPALKRADIGVAMGITGTEVTKEAGDMVLADDNFATIVSAVRRGRAIYDNILSFVRFQLTTNIAAIGSILFARLLGLPTPFTAIQILFVNIIADGPPAVSLGVDPPKPGLMERPPRSPTEAILSGPRLGRIMFGATVMTVLTLAVLTVGEDAVGTSTALTMTFTTFVLLQMANALAVRVGAATVASPHSLTNRPLWLALGSVVLIQVLVVQVPFLQDIFDTVALSLRQWAICFGLAVAYLLVDEIRSFTERQRSRRHPTISA